MQYRKFGKLNWEVSALGFGAMRLPIINEDSGNINETEAIKMIRYAIDHGVNYIDTAYPYHQGISEIVVGKALTKGYRKKVRLATKMPSWLIDSQEDMNKYFEEQLDRLQLKSIDFYLLHGLNKERWHKLRDLNVLDWAERKIEDNKIRYLGFSFHDDYNVFKEIIDSYNGWIFCQVQYNYMDSEYQAGKKGIKYAASKGLAIVVMEPIAGGMLAVTPPQEIQHIWDESEIERTPAEWALQWVWNQPEVSLALSGMSTMKQVIENVESANHSNPNSLSKNDLRIILKVKEKYLEYGFIGCTSCKYCIPCPEDLNIPEILALYNEYYIKDRSQEVKEKYSKTITPEKGAKRCAKCGQCEELCPQQLPIRNLLTKAARLFESN